MSKAYPQLKVRLVGEPADVLALADNLSRRAKHIQDAAIPAYIVADAYLAGPTRARAQTSLDRLRGDVEATGDSLADSAGRLRGWADTIGDYRERLDELDRKVTAWKAKLAELRTALRNLLARRESFPDIAFFELRKGELEHAIGEYDKAVRQAPAEARRIVRSYEDAAEAVGNALQSESLSAPGIPGRTRFVRDLLDFSGSLDPLIDLAELAAALVTGGAAKVGSQALREALDKVSDSIERALIAGAGAKFAADLGAAAGGGKISPVELFFNALNLKGIGPLDRLKGDALDHIDSPATRAAVDQALRKLEERFGQEIFEERRPPRHG